MAKSKGQRVPKTVLKLPLFIFETSHLLRRLLIRILFLLAENVENLIYRVRLLALVGSRILLPQQVPKNARGTTQRIVRTRH